MNAAHRYGTVPEASTIERLSDLRDRFDRRLQERLWRLSAVLAVALSMGLLGAAPAAVALEDGCMQVPEGPGLGVEIDEETVARLAR